MQHEQFPVSGFAFMNAPMSDEQKALIVAAAARLGIQLTDNWPSPFSKWDAARMLTALDEIRAREAWRLQDGEPNVSADFAGRRRGRRCVVNVEKEWIAKNDLDQLIAERDALREQRDLLSLEMSHLREEVQRLKVERYETRIKVRELSKQLVEYLEGQIVDMKATCHDLRALARFRG